MTPASRTIREITVRVGVKAPSPAEFAAVTLNS
jgi:hypothetical protein